jgi:putative transposase
MLWLGKWCPHTAPNQKWGGDISYLWTAEGRLHLAVIIDLYSCRPIGWTVSYRLKRDFPIEGLKVAIAITTPATMGHPSF